MCFTINKKLHLPFLSVIFDWITLHGILSYVVKALLHVRSQLLSFFARVAKPRPLQSNLPSISECRRSLQIMGGAYQRS